MQLTRDDERARRICSLALDFMNARAPLGSAAIARGHYPGLSEDSFRKAFSRDRELLEACGITLVETRAADGTKLWSADADRSFAQETELGPLDAAALELACRSLAEDPTFPLAGELRLALAKVGRAFAETIGARRTGGGRERREIATLRACVASCHAARVAYVDAEGTASERLIAPYAFFGLRGKLYLVAGLLGEDGSPVPDHIRTYRAERFERVVEQTQTSFEVPADFSVDDWRRLPFQMGPTSFEAVLVIPSEHERDVRRAAGTQGRFERRGDSLIWTVPASSAADAASWAVAMGARPVSPTQLVDSWRDVLEGVVGNAE